MLQEDAIYHLFCPNETRCKFVRLLICNNDELSNMICQSFHQKTPGGSIVTKSNKGNDM